MRDQNRRDVVAEVLAAEFGAAVDTTSTRSIVTTLQHGEDVVVTPSGAATIGIVYSGRLTRRGDRSIVGHEDGWCVHGITR